MAGRAARLFIEIGADVRGAAQGIDKVQKQLVNLGKQASAVRNIAIVATGVVAIRRASEAIGDLAEHAAEEQASQVRLQRAIANTGRAIDEHMISSVERWIDAQHEATGFSDNELRDSLASLVAQTGDYEEAQQRLTLATDVARGSKKQLAEAAQLMGRIDDDSLGRLEALIPGITKLAKVEGAAAGAFDEHAAAAMLAERANVDYGAALAAVKRGGPGLDSVLIRHGIATKKMAEEAANGADSYIDVKKALGEVRRVFGGQGADFMKTQAGDLARIRGEVSRLQDELGGAFLPMYAGILRFGVRAIRGVRRMFQLFTTDISGPRFSSARKIWQAAFGDEMPKALGVVVDWFGKIADRTKTFVDDLNSDDPNKVRGAIKAFATGLIDDAKTAVSGFNAELDKLGVTGLIVKVGVASVLFEKATGFGIGAAADIANLLLQIPAAAFFAVKVGSMLGLATPVGIAVSMGVLATLTAFQIVSDITGGDQSIADKITEIGKLAFGVLGAGLIAFGATAGFPLAATIGIGLVLSVVGLHVISQMQGSGIQSSLSDGGFWAHLLFGAAAAAVAVTLGAPVAGALAIGFGAYLTLDILGIVINWPGFSGPPGPGNPAAGGGTAAQICLAAGGSWDEMTATCHMPATAPPPAPPAPGLIPISTPDGPAWGDPVTGNIIPMARGGIVDSPTLALIGEAGPEAVVPLSGRNAGAGMATVNVEVNVQGNVLGMLDLETEIRRAVRDGVLQGGFRGVLV